MPPYSAAEAPAERCPVIGTDLDGNLILAYMERHDRDPWLRWRLRVVPMDIDPSTGDPFARVDQARTLAEGCIATQPAFSSDGRWVGCIPWPEATGERRLRRLSLTGRVQRSSGACFFRR
jgi:hypothetical protein